MILCDYGCGREAKYPPRKGMTKWCCSENFNSCPGKIEIQREKVKGNIPWNKEVKNCFSEETLKRLSESSKKENLSKETRRKLSESSKKENLSLETRMKLSNSLKGRVAWNKGLTKNNNNIIMKMAKDKEGIIPWNKGLDINKSEKIRRIGKNISISRKLNIKQIQKRYPFFSKIEEMRYNPDKPGEKEIQVHCKNHNCTNSKEMGGWFTPTGSQLYERIRQLEKDYGNGGCYFYCSEKCKNVCPLYNLKIKNDILSDEIYYNQEEYQIFRQEVLKRDDYKCVYCGEQAEHVHHTRPQKLEPFFALDPDYAISTCENCHFLFGHKTGTECSTGNLANRICL